MVIVGAAILPHGDFAYSPELLPPNTASRVSAEHVHDGVVKLASDLKLGRVDEGIQIDAIFVTTPHGLALGNSHALYANALLGGECALGGDVCRICGGDEKVDEESDDGYVMVSKAEVSVVRGDGYVNSIEKEVKISLEGSSSKLINDEIEALISNRKYDLEECCGSKPFPRGKGDNQCMNHHVVPRPKLVQSLTAFNDSLPLPLQWGEIVPIASLLKHAASTDDINLQKTSTSNDCFHLPCEMSVLSISSRRYTQSSQMCGELLQLGGTIARALENLPNFRVFWVVSCDLAHTHTENGPYGYRPAAARFDKFAGEWVQSFNRQRGGDDIHPMSLWKKNDTSKIRGKRKLPPKTLAGSELVDDDDDDDDGGQNSGTKIEEDVPSLANVCHATCGDRTLLLANCKHEQEAGAMSCGFTGLVMLQGAMEAIQAQNTKDYHSIGSEPGSCWSTELFANEHPTYYGMMVARFHRKEFSKPVI